MQTEDFDIRVPDRPSAFAHSLQRMLIWPATARGPRNAPGAQPQTHVRGDPAVGHRPRLRAWHRNRGTLPDEAGHLFASRTEIITYFRRSCGTTGMQRLATLPNARLAHLGLDRVEQRLGELAREIAGDEYQPAAAIVRGPAFKERGRMEHVLHAVNDRRARRAFGDGDDAFEPQEVGAAVLRQHLEE